MGPVKTQECLGQSVPSPPAGCHLLHPCRGGTFKTIFPEHPCPLRLQFQSAWHQLGLTCILCKRPPHPAPEPLSCGVGKGGTFTSGAFTCRHGVGWFIEEQIRSSCLSHEMGITTPISQIGSANKSKMLH